MVLIELHSDLENVLCIQNYLVKYADLTLKANQTFFFGWRDVIYFACIILNKSHI